MVSEHARTLGVSERTAQWRLIVGFIVMLGGAVCLVASHLPSSLFQSGAQAKNDTEPHEPYQHEDLRKAVAAALRDRDIGLSAMCDGIYNLTFLYDGTPDSMYGTIAAGTLRLPAIKTHIKFMCVSTIDGARQENSDFWVVLAINYLAKKDRCIKFANEEVVNEVAEQCGYRRG